MISLLHHCDLISSLEIWVLFSFYLCLHMEGREGNSGDQPGHWLSGKDLEIVHFQL